MELLTEEVIDGSKDLLPEPFSTFQVGYRTSFYCVGLIIFKCNLEICNAQ